MNNNEEENPGLLKQNEGSSAVTGSTSLPPEIPNQVRKDISEIQLNGSWENKNRSITAAAFVGLLGIGALYFNVQSILMSVLIFIYQLVFKVEIYGDFLERINQATDQYKTPILIALVISQYLFMLLPAVWITKKWHTTEIKKYLRIKWIPVKETILTVLITITLLPLCYYISYLLLEWLDIPEVIQNLGSQLFTAHSFTEFILLVFVVAVTPAICEEVFFRGYVQRTMERSMGIKSFVITGVIFGLFHMQPLSLISLSILGVLFSFFFYRSKSILPSSAAHFANNFIALLLLYIQTQFTETELYLEGNVPLALVIISTFVSAGLVMLYLRITSNPALLPNH